MKKSAQSTDTLLNTKSPRARRLSKAFNKSFKKVIALHSLAIILFFIYNYGFLKEPIRVMPSLKVDLVALPDLTKKEMANTSQIKKILEEKEVEKPKPPEPKKEEKPKPEPTEPKEPTLKLKQAEEKKTYAKRPSALESAIERVKALQKIEEQVAQPPAKGNNLSKGNQLTGESEAAFDEYLENMRTKLLENWNLPIWLSKQNFSAQVVIFLDRRGGIAQAIMQKKSGNEQFDQYVMKTIHNSEPFGLPPEEILEKGLTFGFPL